MVFGPNEIGSNKMSCFGFLANLMPPLHGPFPELHVRLLVWVWRRVLTDILYQAK
jgi:hypothetical protein